MYIRIYTYVYTSFNAILSDAGMYDFSINQYNKGWMHAVVALD